MFFKHIVQIVQSHVILVAYRGYSDSDGVPSEQGIKIDAETIVNYALEFNKKNNLDLFVYGKSLGGAVAIHVASSPYFQNKIDGLIL